MDDLGHGTWEPDQPFPRNDVMHRSPAPNGPIGVGISLRTSGLASKNGVQSQPDMKNSNIVPRGHPYRCRSRLDQALTRRKLQTQSIHACISKSTCFLHGLTIILVHARRVSFIARTRQTWRILKIEISEIFFKTQKRTIHDSGNSPT